MIIYRLEIYFYGERYPYSTEFFSNKPSVNVLSLILEEDLTKHYNDDIAIDLILTGKHIGKNFDCWLEEIGVIDV